jgi:hypothetical protein
VSTYIPPFHSLQDPFFHSSSTLQQLSLEKQQTFYITQDKFKHSTDLSPRVQNSDTRAFPTHRLMQLRAVLFIPET